MEVSQLLVYILLIAGVLGFNLLMRYLNSGVKGWQKKLEQQQQEATEVAQPEDLTKAAAGGAPWGGSARDHAADEPLEVMLARRERAAERRGPGNFDPSAAQALVRPATTQRRRTQPMFRSQAELRQALVIITVLGPCRANAPYGQDDLQGSARPRR